jgi:hypothetical protein
MSLIMRVEMKKKWSGLRVSEFRERNFFADVFGFDVGCDGWCLNFP